MPLYLPTRTGGATCAIAYCDRCKAKRYYDDLVHDDNSPGLRVCPECVDESDPWRLPARRNENIGLKHPRVGTAITLDADENLQTQYGQDLIFPPNITVE